MAEFLSWRLTQLRSFGTGPAIGGRLQAQAPIALQDVLTGAPGNGAGPFELFGPGDVARLAPGVISRRYPAPGAIDAEETKRALVEFAGEDLLDLPWRYSPETDAGQGIRPWLVLVVGAPGDITVSRDGKVTLSTAVQATHPLAQSRLWAHVHRVGGQSFARILNPLKDMTPATYYVAALVPAFVVEANGTLRDAWPAPGGGPVRLPCYDSWSFRTGPDGDFHEIAARLKATTAGLLGPKFGRATVRYDRRGSGDPPAASLSTTGALQRPDLAGTSPAAVEPWIAEEIAARADDLPTPDGRWVLTAPRYHAPFVATGAAPTAGWSAALNTDPRERGAAGLGAWAAIAWQERIAAAAATKAGDLQIARDRVGHLALGLEASRSLWRRRVPEDPVERLAVLAPVLGRLPAKEGGTVLDQISGRTPLMARALWSSAARRALRPGPARSARAAPGAGRLSSILEIAARCPEPRPDPEEVPVKADIKAEAKIAAAKEAIFNAARGDDELASQIADHLFQNGEPPDPAHLAAILAALDPGGGAKPDRERVFQVLFEPPRPFDPGDVIDIIGGMGGLAGKPTPCRGFLPGRLGDAVGAAVDPTVARPVVVDRVLGTLDGVDDIGPIEIEPELDLPLWRFLADASPDWLLPGVGDLPQDRVVGLATNPAFVEALLVGANHQSLGELRWRNMPIAPRWSPLRKFWQRAGGRLDIAPIKNWPAAAGFGAPQLEPAGNPGTEAVVVFRTTLFRRYPSTVVYLYRDNDWVPPPNGQPLLDADKRFPTFTGSIGPDVTFFGFPVPPEELKNHWVVLEEPPGGYRFYNSRDNVAVPAGATADGADFAIQTFAVPVRVMIGRLIEGV